MKIKTSKIPVTSRGSFQLNVYKADGTEVLEKQIKKTENVVTYEGAYAALFDGNIFGGMRAIVGTGTTEITRTDTSLGNKTATGNNIGAAVFPEVDNEDGTATHTYTRTSSFALGGVVGTISEVGLEASTTFIAGQLIKDEFGNPTTLTLLSDEQLVVSYTLEFTYPNGSLAVQASIGSGQVTTPTGTSDYNLYGQPWKNNYLTARNNIVDTWVRAEYISNVYTINDSQGDVLFAKNSASSLTTTRTVDVVVIDFKEVIMSPSEFNSTDIAFITAGSGSASNTYGAQVDNVTKRTSSSAGGFGSSNSTMMVAEFDAPLTKTDTDSMTVHLTIEFQL